ncbi:MAG: hypothetical protein IK011_05325 [Bacteroidaceae bacterium]|nr:hypothetical protein [Bacteroidaceae bacterium]
MELCTILKGRIGGADVLALAQSADREELFMLLFNEDKRTSNNAAWVMTHLPSSDDAWLTEKQQALINEAMRTTSITMRRLTMTLLLRTEFSADDIRTDFLDFCLDMMMRPDQPNGVRSVAMKLAFLQCCHFPELLAELRQTLDIMEPEFLSPALKTTKRTLLKKIRG